MTENEFIKERQKILKSMSDTVCLTKEEAKCILEELEQYRAIGTAAECREAMKRQKAKELAECGERSNYDICCDSIEKMAHIIDIMKCGWSIEEIIEWLKRPAQTIGV